MENIGPDLSKEILSPRAKSCLELLEEYNRRCEYEGEPSGELLEFPIDGDIRKLTSKFDLSEVDEGIAAEVYNITEPVEIEGEKHIFVRVERKGEDQESELSSKVIIFRENTEERKWEYNKEDPVFELQDPFYCGIVQGRHIFGGVQVYKNPDIEGDIAFRTVFYSYEKDISELKDENGKISEPFCVGPYKMKDIRIIELSNGKIGVFTRPQENDRSDYGGKGKVGYFEIDTLNDLENGLRRFDEEKDDSKLLQGLFLDDEWGGVNELHMLSDKKIGVIGHIAHMEKKVIEGEEIEVRNYYVISFIFDPETRVATDVKIISTADNYPYVKPKKKSLGKVQFPGGLIRNNDGTGALYSGLGDTKPGRGFLKDPFWDHEQAVHKATQQKL